MIEWFNAVRLEICMSGHISAELHPKFIFRVSANHLYWCCSNSSTYPTSKLQLLSIRTSQTRLMALWPSLALLHHPHSPLIFHRACSQTAPQTKHVIGDVQHDNCVRTSRSIARASVACLDDGLLLVLSCEPLMPLLPTLGRRFRHAATRSRSWPPLPFLPPYSAAVGARRFATDNTPSPSVEQAHGGAAVSTSRSARSFDSSPPPPSASVLSSTSFTAGGYDQGMSVQPNVSWAASAPSAVAASSRAAASPPPPTAADSHSPAPLHRTSRSSRRGLSGGAEFFVDIDESGLLAHPERPYVDPRQNSAKGRLTPLAAELHEQIKVRGPLTMSDFMYQCMQNAQYGYYTSKENVIGGRASSGPNSGAPVGDFITSPEISQLFGELVGVWMVDAWHKLGKPPSLSLVELGPGRGTLMRDMLRTIRHWPAMHSAVEVHLLETSQLMRDKQRDMLGVTLQEDGRAPFYSPATVFPSTSAAAASPSSVILPPEYTVPSTPPLPSPAPASTTSSSSNQFGDVRVSGFTRDRVRVTWHSSLASLPSSRPVLFVGHEFLDALPVYHFVYRKERGWSEVLVDADYSTDSPHHFRLVLSPTATPALSVFVGERAGEENEMVEVQAASASIVEDITQRIGRQTGAALFIDYATSQPSRPTLQAIQSHQHVHPLHEPGLTDLTTLVDFQAMAASADKAASIGQHDVFTLPVITQNSFLRNMNIARRLEMLVDAVWDKASTSQQQQDGAVSEEETERLADDMIQAATRLVSEDRESGGMGGLFHVMAVVHSKLGTDIAAWNEAEVREKRQRDERKRAESKSQTLAKNVPPVMRQRRGE